MVGEMAGLQSQSGRRVQSTVAVEKLTRQNNGRKHFALGSPTNDVLSFPRHFLSLQFGCLGRREFFKSHACSQQLRSVSWERMIEATNKLSVRQCLTQEYFVVQSSSHENTVWYFDTSRNRSCCGCWNRCRR